MFKPDLCTKGRIPMSSRVCSLADECDIYNSSSLVFFPCFVNLFYFVFTDRPDEMQSHNAASQLRWSSTNTPETFYLGDTERIQSYIFPFSMQLSHQSRAWKKTQNLINHTKCWSDSWSIWIVLKSLLINFPSQGICHLITCLYQKPDTPFISLKFSDSLTLANVAWLLIFRKKKVIFCFYPTNYWISF